MRTGTEIDAEEAKAELAAVAEKSGALVSGVAGADAFTEAPEGRRPADILPKAMSVFVVGGAQPRAGDWQSPNYQHMEVTTTADRMQTLALKIARIIEDHFGYYAVCVPPGVDRGQQPFMSIAMAADAAGCGSKSLAGPVLHPDYGFMYYGAIVTTMPLPADELLDPLPRKPDIDVEVVELERLLSRGLLYRQAFYGRHVSPAFPHPDLFRRLL